MLYKAEIPYGAYWSSPFSRWQGSLANLHAVKFGADTAKKELEKRNIPVDDFDYAVLGSSVPQKGSFYGAPWLAGLVGADKAGGPMIYQACATGVRTLLSAVQEIEVGMAEKALVVNADRTSNGPHILYPNPSGPGGTGDSENWVMDNFSCDPLGGHSMLQTAENVAKKHQVSTEAQHEVVLRRTEQYQAACADDHAFHKRYMTLPFEVPDPRFRKVRNTLEGDEGITISTAEGLAKLKPVMPDGTVTFGGQTHPADGNAGLVVTTPERAKELSKDSSIRIRIHGFGLARAERAHMPEATIPAATRALAQAGMSIDKMDAITSHNPFAVNDIVFAKEMGWDPMNMNNFGCSLIWGHPQAPTGTRSIIELIEELAMRGGGYGLFEGCAAGDTAMAVVIQVGE
ncbi:MAG: thiolase family protein [Rhodospirillales bacterium]|nr:thiolase family protein [Rhodospirillales bacterium]